MYIYIPVIEFFLLLFAEAQNTGGIEIEGIVKTCLVDVEVEVIGIVVTGKVVFYHPDVLNRTADVRCYL